MLLLYRSPSSLQEKCQLRATQMELQVQQTNQIPPVVIGCNVGSYSSFLSNEVFLVNGHEGHLKELD